MRFQVVHTTRYSYSSPASLCYNLLHLGPRETLTQRVLHSELHIEPRPDDRSRRLDEHGNEVEYVTIERPHDGLVVTSICELQVEPYDVSPAAAPVLGGDPRRGDRPDPGTGVPAGEPAGAVARRAGAVRDSPRSRPAARCWTRWPT